MHNLMNFVRVEFWNCGLYIRTKYQKSCCIFGCITTSVQFGEKTRGYGF